MPWFRVEDDFHNHPKVRTAGNAAIGLWVLAGTWSAHYLTDGYVPTNVLGMFGSPAEGRRLAARLVDAGLWKPAADGWQFHDWDVYQPSRVQTLAKRASERQRLRAIRGRGQ